MKGMIHKEIWADREFYWTQLEKQPGHKTRAAWRRETRKKASAAASRHVARVGIERLGNAARHGFWRDSISLGNDSQVPRLAVHSFCTMNKDCGGRGGEGDALAKV
ncbi:hypothetical protein JDV02_003512 [Purpureocillium takamizusanense]|uniref:Uncharacterized protein n=1 Tax=Purpureocillium takamizusanense TaxID=2060973 RepID=A0A9Q8V9V9_9HYPO|nr:uncharacterized protein JDV02_003512 [Purpureocillium takamizusanense]UNI17136.1 hypothetical protein JDV02_003512 [Purpureocillium takamizusanense]